MTRMSSASQLPFFLPSFLFLPGRARLAPGLGRCRQDLYENQVGAFAKATEWIVVWMTVRTEEIEIGKLRIYPLSSCNSFAFLVFVLSLAPCLLKPCLLKPRPLKPRLLKARLLKAHPPKRILQSASSKPPPSKPYLPYLTLPYATDTDDGRTTDGRTDGRTDDQARIEESDGIDGLRLFGVDELKAKLAFPGWDYLGDGMGWDRRDGIVVRWAS